MITSPVIVTGFEDADRLFTAILRPFRGHQACTDTPTAPWSILRMLSHRIVALTLCLAGSLLPPASASTRVPVTALAPQAVEPRTIEVIARRYAFEPATIEAVEGERLRILVKSGDGLHGFEI